MTDDVAWRGVRESLLKEKHAFLAHLYIGYRGANIGNKIKSTFIFTDLFLDTFISRSY